VEGKGCTESSSEGKKRKNWRVTGAGIVKERGGNGGITLRAEVVIDKKQRGRFRK